MQYFKTIVSILPPWTVVVLASIIGIVAACVRVFDSRESKARRAQLKSQKELKVLAEKISVYGRMIHQQYPSGDVVVSERDLADQLRKRPEAVATALNLLLNEQKVQRAPLSGYWKISS